MARLRFPSLESLRLAVTAGIVPRDADPQPLRGAVDAHGAVWVEGWNAKEALASLARLGVSMRPPGLEPPLQPLADLLELVPLKPAAVVSTRRRLVVPDRAAARVHALLDRLGIPVDIRLSAEPGKVWFTATRLPAYLTDQAAELGGRAYGEVRSGCWMTDGWTHPLADHLSAPGGLDWLLTPERPWIIVPHEVAPPATIQPARRHAGRLIPAIAEGVARPDDIPVRVALKSMTRGRSATLWRLDGTGEAALRDLAEALDDRKLNRVSTATYPDPPDRGTTWVRVESPRSKASLTTAWSGGFAEHPEIAGLFVPHGLEMSPRLRPRIAAQLFGVGIGKIVVVEAKKTDGTWKLHHINVGDFRPLAQRCDFTMPLPQRHIAPRDAGRFALPAFTADVESTPDHVKPVAQMRPVPAPYRPSAPSRTEPEPWWSAVSHWTGRTLARLQRRRGTYKPGKTATELPAVEGTTDRIRDQLASHHALLLGHEWNARRLELEQQIVTEMPQLNAVARAALWSHVAAVYGSTGQNGEAALCRLNAVWDGESTAREAASAWWKAEVRAARLGDRPQDWIAHAGPASARTAAAYLCHAASSLNPPSEAVDQRWALLQLVMRWEAELPVRAAWLGQSAAAKLAGGDPLTLAHVRDRLLGRLNDLGPSLDLDAPGFLRFRRGPSGERFQTARDWLLRVREPMHRWLAKLQGNGRLQWAGIDPEAAATPAYADLIWAWGFSRLGDRLRAKELEQEARKVLTVIRGHGIVPGVHVTLLNQFSERIRNANDVRSSDTIVPLPNGEGDDLAKYAVARLQTGLGVLNAIPFHSAFAGREVVGFLGTDELGDRLRTFLTARGTAAQTPWEARRLLAVDEADPTAVTMPRVLFTLLERADELDAHLIAAVIPQTIRAVELIPEWVRLGLQDRDAAAVTLRYGRRMLIHAARAAELFHMASSLQDLAEQLIEHCTDRDGLHAHLARSCSADLMRVLRRLGLTVQAGVLATRLNGPDPIAPAKLGLTGGLYAAGDDDAAGRLLDEARTKLFVRKIPDDRERTDMALAYAAALATAPHGIALGRLEELFQRLEMINTTGAANRYYTLNPLRLIDAVVRAVIGDDFTLGPAARAWLVDDEFLIRRRIARDFESALEIEAM